MADSNDIEIKEGEKYVTYASSSEACNSLGSTVPIGFAREQVFFNSDLKSVLFDVDEYVKERLRYKSVEEMCKAFAREQIDAIATAIYNWERNGNAMIVSDQTGLGKGRIVAGLIRYSILSLGKTPIFFTEKQNLFSDIYRDLYDIGLDAGVSIEKQSDIVQVDEDELTDAFIIKVIKRDIKGGDLRVDFTIPNDEPLNSLFSTDFEDQLEEVIELYREHILENGVEEGSGRKKVDSKTLQKEYLEASKQGRIQVVPYAPFPVDIINKVGDIIYSVKKADADLGIRQGEISTKYRLILMLYSTCSKNIYKDDALTPKGVLINRLAEDNVIIMDESHNAAGTSFRREVIIQMLRSAKYATYVSATWAKRPNNLPLYSVRTSIRDCYLSFRQIEMAFESGGLALQEAVSSKLVSSGQLIRRERPFDGVVDYYEEDSNTSIGQTQIEKLNRVTLMWEKILEHSALVRTTLKTETTRLLPAEDQIETRKQIKYKGKVGRLTFQFFNYFLIGLKVQQCAQEALTQLRDGKKVVIAIGNTLESAFTNLKKDYQSQNSYNIGDRIRNDFSLMLEYLLYYTMYVGHSTERVSNTGEDITVTSKTNLVDMNWRNEFEGVTLDTGVDVNDVFEEVRYKVFEEYRKIQRDDIFALGLPLSPIDMIKAIIRNEGFSIEEITGREKELVFESDADGNVNFEYGILSQRRKLQRQEIVNDFNSNVLDCVIINQSGSTGLSLHAVHTEVQGKIVAPVNQPPKGVVTPIPMSLEPRNEVKQRCMLILQMELNVATEMQKLGRINRTGQIYPPIYKYIISAIPSEARLSAMMQKKLKSLMASTTGEQDFGKDIFNLDDLFSETAVIPWNNTCAELNFGSDYIVKNASEIESKTKLFYFMSYTRQNQFFNKLSENLQKHIIDLTEKGQYFAKIKYQDYRAKTESIIPFIIGDNNATSEFANHTFAELAECTVYDTKNTEYIIKQEIIGKSEIYDFSIGYTSIYNNIADFQKKAISQANEIADLYVNERRESIAQSETSIKTYQDIKANAETSAKKIPLVDSVVQLEEDIVQLEKEKTRLNALILKNIEDDVEDKNIAPQVQQVSKQLKQLSEQLSNLLGSEFANSGEVRTKLRETERTIKNAIDQIGYYERGIVRLQNEINKENLTKSRYIDFVSNIGNVYAYKNYEQVVIKSDDPNGDDTYMYNLNIDSDAVLVGVKFDFGNELHFTPSAIQLTFLTITNTYNVTLSILYPSLSDEEINMGMKPIEELIPKNQNYENYWDNYIKGIDTGYRKNKVFLSGNLLRGIAFNYLLNFGGNITKYSTDTNKLQISLELNEASTNKIMPSFNDGTNYGLLAGLSIDNITRLFPQMLATAIFYGKSSFASQLLYDGSPIFLLCTLQDNTYQELRYESGNYIDEDEFVNYAKPIIANDFEQKVIFTITASRSEPIQIFDNICVGLGSEAQYDYGDVYNYRGDDKKHFLFEIKTPTTTSGRGRKKQEQIDWGSPIETLMSHPFKSFTKEYSSTPNNKVDYIIGNEVLEAIRNANTGNLWFTPKYNLTMSPSLFYSIITYLKAQFVQLVGVISSDNLNRSEPKFIFDIASLTRGAIDNTGIVQIQGVGNSLYQPLEDIVNEFLAYYKSIK